MAITVGNLSNSGDPGAATSYSWNHTCIANTTCLVVGVAGQDSSDADIVINSITYNSIALTRASETFSGATPHFRAIWYLLAPATGSSLAITVTHAGKCTDTSAAAIDLLGTATSSVVDNKVEDASVVIGNPLTATVNPAVSGSISIGSAWIGNGVPANLSVTAGTQIAEIDLGSIMGGFAYAFTSGGVATISWTDTVAQTSFANAVTFKPPAVAAIPNKIYRYMQAIKRASTY